MKSFEFKGTVQMRKRNPWQLFKFGWYRHDTLVGPSWIRFVWPYNEDVKEAK